MTQLGIDVLAAGVPAFRQQLDADFPHSLSRLCVRKRFSFPLQVYFLCFISSFLSSFLFVFWSAIFNPNWKPGNLSWGVTVWFRIEA